MISTNYSNSASSPSVVSFKARFNVDIPVKELKKLADIQEMFAAKTQHYAGDTLILTKSKDPSFSNYPVLTTGKVEGSDYKYAHIFENFNEMLESMPESQLVKKLISYFKMLKKEEELSNYNSRMDKSIEHMRLSLLNNAKRSKYCEAAGNETLASRFKVLAENNQRKLISLQNDKQKGADKILSNMDKIAAEEPELKYVPEILRDDAL